MYLSKKEVIATIDTIRAHVKKSIDKFKRMRGELYYPSPFIQDPNTRIKSHFRTPEQWEDHCTEIAGVVDDIRASIMALEQTQAQATDDNRELEAYLLSEFPEMMKDAGGKMTAEQVAIAILNQMKAQEKAKK